MTFQELCRMCHEHNEQNNVTTQFGDENPLICYVTFKSENFKKNYSLEERTYRFVSSNKFFITGLGGSSIFAECLGDNDYIRLDWYNWTIENCYIEHNGVRYE